MQAKRISAPSRTVQISARKKESMLSKARCKAAAALDSATDRKAMAEATFVAALAVLSQAGDKKMVAVLRPMLASFPSQTDYGAYRLCLAAAKLLKSCER